VGNTLDREGTSNRNVGKKDEGFEEFLKRMFS
jgi:hypothetical protein